MPDIFPECIDQKNGEILSDKLVEDENSIWFFDVMGQMCRSIQYECLNTANSNKFHSLNECKSQCLPNMNEKKTQGKRKLKHVILDLLTTDYIMIKLF